MGLYIATTYVDVTNPERRVGCGEDHPYETAHDKPGELFRALQGRSRLRPWEESMGRCTGKIHIGPDAQHIGWVFLSRRPCDGDGSGTWLCESWVTVHTAPDTVTRTPHYAPLGG